MTAATGSATLPADRMLRRAAWTAVILLTLVNVINYLDRMVIVLLAAPIKQQFDLSDTQYSILTGIGFVTVYSISGVALARLADRTSRKRVIAASLAAWSVMTIVCGAAQSFGQLLVARAGVGIGEAGGIPGSYSIISSYFDAKRRALPLAIFSAGSPLGILICFILGAMIFDRWGWRATFFAAALPGLLLAVFILIFVQEPADADPAMGRRESVNTCGAMRTLLAIPSFRWLIAGQAIAAFGSIGMLQWLPLFAMRSHGVGVAQVGLLFGPAIAAGMTIGLLGGGGAAQWLSRQSPPSMLHLCIWPTLALIPLFLIGLWSPSRGTAIVAIFVAMLTGVISAPAYIAAMQEMCPPALRSTAAAVAGILSSVVGSGLLPLAVGAISDALRPAYGDGGLRIALSIGVAAFAPGAWLFARCRSAWVRQHAPAVQA